MFRNILEFGRAWFRASDSPEANELCLDAKPHTMDPTKVRQGTFDPGNYFGAFSGDFLVGDPENPTRYEKVLVALKPDDDSAVRQFWETHPGGVFEVFTQAAGTSDDAHMIRALRISAMYVELFGHRLITRHPDGSVTWHLGEGGGSPASRFYSDDGRYCFNVQGDDGGKIVQYDTHGSSDESGWTAVGELRARRL